MSKLLQSRDGIFLFSCPACKCSHWINSTWEIKYDEQGRLTVNPSIKVRYTKMPDIMPLDEFGKYILENGRIKGSKDMICHLYIRNNQIQYLSDCTHELAGKTIDMEDVEE